MKRRVSDSIFYRESGKLRTDRAMLPPNMVLELRTEGGFYAQGCDGCARNRAMLSTGFNPVRSRQGPHREARANLGWYHEAIACKGRALVPEN